MKILCTVGVLTLLGAVSSQAATNISELITEVQGNWTAAIAVGLTIMGILLGVSVVRKALHA